MDTTAGQGARGSEGAAGGKSRFLSTDRNWIDLPESSSHSQEETHSFLLTLQPAHSSTCIHEREELWVNGCGFVS